MQDIKRHYLVLPVFCLLLSACDSIPTPAPSATATETGGNKTQEGQVVFSDLQELDYSPNSGTYRLAVSDTLDVAVADAKEFSGRYTIDADGNISIPLLEDIRAEGLTLPQLQQTIATTLQKKYLQNPQVDVSVQKYGDQYITLDGEFSSPGIQAIKSTSISFLQAVAQGRDLTKVADPSRIVLFRRAGDTVKAYHLDVDAIRKGTMRNPYLKNNDLLVAYRSNARYWLQEVTGTMNNVGSIVRSVTLF